MATKGHFLDTESKTGPSRQAWMVLWIIGVLTVVTEVIWPHFAGGHGAHGADPHGAEHAAEAAAHWWSSIPGFYAIFGLVGCLAIILFSKWIGHAWLMGREDYWDHV